ncbi:MAG: hypothetical protein II282_03475 [Alistipes sp.]|nr:hypothetical protein [Alistipes sp.]MBQ6583639.1 hypothetical protein [Alistipes sp.]
MGSTLQDQQIVSRFYQAVDALYALGEIHRIRELERDMGVNHGNFYQQRKDFTRRTLRPSWLRHLVVVYGVSADWLLIGEGRMFR